MTFDELCLELMARGYLQFVPTEDGGRTLGLTVPGEIAAAQLLQIEGEYMREWQTFIRLTLGGTGG